VTVVVEIIVARIIIATCTVVNYTANASALLSHYYCCRLIAVSLQSKRTITLAARRNNSFDRLESHRVVHLTFTGIRRWRCAGPKGCFRSRTRHQKSESPFHFRANPWGYVCKQHPQWLSTTSVASTLTHYRPYSTITTRMCIGRGGRRRQQP
jgi:hypothetical protein